MKPKSINQMPDDATPYWVTENGRTYWLEASGQEYETLRWVYHLCAEAEKKGRNDARQNIRRELEREE